MEGVLDSVKIKVIKRYAIKINGLDCCLLQGMYAIYCYNNCYKILGNFLLPFQFRVTGEYLPPLYIPISHVYRGLLIVILGSKLP